MTEHEPFLLKSALRIAVHGMAVFPLRPHTKLPAVPQWPRAATRDVGAIRAWWERSAFNIGVATGGPSEIVVVDLDAPKSAGDPHGRQSLAALVRNRGQTIPRGTRTVVTPSVIQGTGSCCRNVLDEISSACVTSLMKSYPTGLSNEVVSHRRTAQPSAKRCGR